MRDLRRITSVILFLFTPTNLVFAQQKVNLGDNAALRYWSAFAQMQDAAISDEQVKQLNLILEGTSPYADLEYKDLLEKNRLALQTMARGTTLQKCDWGIDYQLGSETPVDYVRKALALGRLNVLYSLHFLVAGVNDEDSAVGALAAGLRFSRDVANGGTLFATLASKSLIVQHLRVIEFAAHGRGLSPRNRQLLRDAIAQFSRDGLDWQAAMKRELELPRPNASDPQASSARARIEAAYLKVLEKPEALAEVQGDISSAPKSVQDTIPNPKRVLEAKQDLADKLLQARSILQ
jgi:hypothetical protein